MITYQDDYPVGDWIITDNPQDLLRTSKLYGKKKFVFDLNVSSLEKSELKLIEKNSKNDICFINKFQKSEVNPFELATSWLTLPNRKMVWDYLNETKANLWLPLRYLNCGYFKLTPKNQQVLEFLNTNLFKVNPEILYAKIAFGMESQQKPWIKWLYPKKKKED